MSIQERYYQTEAVNSIFDYYASGKTGNPVVAMPTATGKSVVIARFIQQVMQRWPKQRFACLTHVKELIDQNSKKMQDVWPEVPMGICSAGLNQRNTIMPVLMGGVQTVVNCVERLGWRDLMLIDEAHLLSPNDGTNYQKVIQGLKLINPALKVVGFTATPYRLGQGLITDGGIFTDFCYDITGLDAFNKLIDEGYLCSLIPKQMDVELDVSEVTVTAGDYNQADLQKAVDKDKITYEACKEIVAQGQDRSAWLIFASGIEHSMHIATMLYSMGISVAPVHSKMPAKDCDKYIADFRAGKIQAIVNYGKLTTGFDYPEIDLIAMLRPTMSTALWVQMLGRGTRPVYESGFDLSTNEGRVAAIAAGPKKDCKVLDFARNTIRLGPINDPVIPRRRSKSAQPGVVPIKICPTCGTYNHTRAVKCCSCDYEFPKQQRLTDKAATDVLIRRSDPTYITVSVDKVIYSSHVKGGSLVPTMKVTYFCNGGLQKHDEYICLQHRGLPGTKARTWWLNRAGSLPPADVTQALSITKQLKVPKQLKIRTDQKYPEIVMPIW